MEANEFDMSALDHVSPTCLVVTFGRLIVRAVMDKDYPDYGRTGLQHALHALDPQEELTVYKCDDEGVWAKLFEGKTEAPIRRSMPTVGRIVHYFHNGREGEEPRAAIVARVNDNQTINIEIAAAHSPTDYPCGWRGGVAQRTATERVGVWDWPARA
ncbi:MAG: hypothetical protein COA96_16820 [SAR86 cluster bacterium]|uniref:Uncharacterized protein n=1 Tax=SAR86 cluster bacterium TaxID=2030880 RepID=A0A2A5AG24_9GAMM|nr:MAG: hypothetical protein COA96_16820 [SAR86 cluster bacterium]